MHVVASCKANLAPPPPLHQDIFRRLIPRRLAGTQNVSTFARRQNSLSPSQQAVRSAPAGRNHTHFPRVKERRVAIAYVDWVKMIFAPKKDDCKLAWVELLGLSILVIDFWHYGVKTLIVNSYASSIAK
jgi:hypothetical protein